MQNELYRKIQLKGQFISLQALEHDLEGIESAVRQINCFLSILKNKNAEANVHQNEQGTNS